MLTFDDAPAPVLSQDGEYVTVQIPYELAGKQSALMKIGQATAKPLEVTVAVADSAPGIYAGNGQARPTHSTKTVSSML